MDGLPTDRLVAARDRRCRGAVTRGSASARPPRCLARCAARHRDVRADAVLDRSDRARHARPARPARSAVRGRPRRRAGRHQPARPGRSSRPASGSGSSCCGRGSRSAVSRGAAWRSRRPTLRSRPTRRTAGWHWSPPPVAAQRGCARAGGASTRGGRVDRGASADRRDPRRWRPPRPGTGRRRRPAARLRDRAGQRARHRHGRARRGANRDQKPPGGHRGARSDASRSERRQPPAGRDLAGELDRHRPVRRPGDASGHRGSRRRGRRADPGRRDPRRSRRRLPADRRRAVGPRDRAGPRPDLRQTAPGPVRRVHPVPGPAAPVDRPAGAGRTRHVRRRRAGPDRDRRRDAGSAR